MEETLTQEKHDEKITRTMIKLAQNDELTDEEAIYFINALLSGGNNEYRCLISDYIIMLTDALFDLELHKKELPIAINDIYKYIKEAVIEQIEGGEDVEKDVYVNNTIAMSILKLYDIVTGEFSEFKEKNEELLKTINDKCVASELKEEDASKLINLTNNIIARVREKRW